jgi:hypothetical protein
VKKILLIFPVLFPFLVVEYHLIDQMLTAVRGANLARLVTIPFIPLNSSKLTSGIL